jgi:hypothetical protein
MAQKPKARSAKKKAVPKRRAPDEKQFERFVETARSLGVDESGKEFESAFKKIALPKK